MSDIVDRRVVIDAIWAHLRNILKKVNFKDSDYDRPAIDAYKMAHQHIAEVVDHLPSADSEIVHCKDCKHCEVYSNGYNSMCTLGNLMDDVLGFCSDAERRDDGNS